MKVPSSRCGSALRVRSTRAPKRVLRIALLVARFGIDAGAQREARVEEPRIDVEQFALQTALRVVRGKGERASAAEEIAVAEPDADGDAFVAAGADGEADLARLGFGRGEIEPEFVAVHRRERHAQSSQTARCAASRGRSRRAFPDCRPAPCRCAKRFGKKVGAQPRARALVFHRGPAEAEELLRQRSSKVIGTGRRRRARGIGARR